ncbi:FAS1 domain-containing protein SELMODRAFT_448915 [Andrographis paniculata]|uniref:FAS1 domain-containing protein SELMODRAFT_448915 n=1 Tax=Andrographis paniculata TaxID=175694 RepID=UPI0021E897E6|nr:FAS1 domain-containing protein SELMODRAFT_448915 [Andrographis paniculata]
MTMTMTTLSLQSNILLLLLALAGFLSFSSSSSPSPSSSPIPPSAAPANNNTSNNNNMGMDMAMAVAEMQRANYFAFAMLINMAPPDLVEANVTFLMPSDKSLSQANLAGASIADFLLRHSIPWPLLFEHMDHFPTGSIIPTSKPGFVLNVVNHGTPRLFFNNARTTSPNICTHGPSIRCHGIDGVLHPSLLPPADTATCPPAPAAAAAAPTAPAHAPPPPRPSSAGNIPQPPSPQPPESVEVGADDDNPPKSDASLDLMRIGRVCFFVAVLTCLIIL